MKIVQFTAASGNVYELHIEGETIPGLLYETDDGKIHDAIHETTWDSLADMSHALKLEIIDWGSDLGD